MEKITNEGEEDIPVGIKNLLDKIKKRLGLEIMYKDRYNTSKRVLSGDAETLQGYKQSEVEGQPKTKKCHKERSLSSLNSREFRKK